MSLPWQHNLTVVKSTTPPTIVCDTPEFRGIMQRRKKLLNKKTNLVEVFGEIYTVNDNTGCCLS